jgi:mono/diheme cytochrome c family protein
LEDDRYFLEIIMQSIVASIPTFSTTVLFTMILAIPAKANGLAEQGKIIATTWCANCHVVQNDQPVASADVPAFATIAEKYADDMDVLGAFLADPHPVMPDMSLTRQEISDLVAYIGSLR